MIEQDTDSITLTISPTQIISAVRSLSKEQQESFIEDLLAAISPEYLESIREARADYEAGRVQSHTEVFG
jgi:PHD/YefM family antitoxin component YafN of YafNO toxin-antitoxin module